MDLLLVVFTVIVLIYIFKKLEQSTRKELSSAVQSVAIEDSGIHVSQSGKETLIGYNHIQIITDTTILGIYGSRTLNVYCNDKSLNFNIANANQHIYLPNYLQIREALIEKANLIKICSPPLRSIWAKNKEIPALKRIQIKVWLLSILLVVLPAVVFLTILLLRYGFK
jgi:hypothetical protein